MDAKIAGWLLDPDNCAVTFQQLLQLHTDISPDVSRTLFNCIIFVFTV